MSVKIEETMPLQELLAPFPSQEKEDSNSKSNPALRLYGRRYHKDQTPIEYLAEFLLVFVSPKCNPDSEENGEFKFRACEGIGPLEEYWPKDRVSLKLFAFFPSSKLETRHPVHRQAYLAAIDQLRSAVKGTQAEQEDTVRLIQSLFGGFVGVAKNRTWATHTFLPVSNMLLARELDWQHSKALGNQELNEWHQAEDCFVTDRHNFMARGGELLFLQLANLFSDPEAPEITEIVKRPEYRHVSHLRLQEIEHQLQVNLRAILEDAIRPLNSLANMIERKLCDYEFRKQKGSAKLGWVPAVSRVEALLFASEMNNICSMPLSSLEKLDLLQTLCSFHVLRSLCFQASRADNQTIKTSGFTGNYCWIASDPSALPRTAIRQLAETTLGRIDALLYRVLRRKDLMPQGVKSSMNEADKNGFEIFKRIAKKIGLVIPPTGRGERFVLNPGHLRFLVAALVRPGEYLRLNDFYHRVFAHYGIALGGEPLATAQAWSGGSEQKSYGLDVSTAWVEEALQQGGFLIELSDAVSIVHNPGAGEDRL